MVMTMEPLRNYSVPRSVLMLIVAEMMNATPHVLQNVLTGGVLHWLCHLLLDDDALSERPH